MAAPTSTQVFGFGRLIANPTTAVKASNYGGTVLGTVGAVALRPRMRSDPQVSEMRGGQVVDVLYRGPDVDAVVLFKGWDDDALAIAFGSTTADLVKLPGTQTSGSWLGDTSFGLLLAPDRDASPGFYMPRAVAMHDRLEIPFSGYLPIALALRFLALPPASGDLCQIGTVADLQAGWTS